MQMSSYWGVRNCRGKKNFAPGSLTFVIMENRGEGSTAAPADKPPGPPRATAAATGTAGAGRAVGGKAALPQQGKLAPAGARTIQRGKPITRLHRKRSKAPTHRGRANQPKLKGNQKGKIPASFSAFDARLSEMETVLAQIKEVLPLCKPPTASATGSVSDNSYAGPTRVTAEEDNDSTSQYYPATFSHASSRQMITCQ